MVATGGEEEMLCFLSMGIFGACCEYSEESKNSRLVPMSRCIDTAEKIWRPIEIAASDIVCLRAAYSTSTSAVSQNAEAVISWIICDTIR